MKASFKFSSQSPRDNIAAIVEILVYSALAVLGGLLLGVDAMDSITVTVTLLAANHLFSIDKKVLPLVTSNFYELWKQYRNK